MVATWTIFPCGQSFCRQPSLSSPIDWFYPEQNSAFTYQFAIAPIGPNRICKRPTSVSYPVKSVFSISTILVFCDNPYHFSFNGVIRFSLWYCPKRNLSSDSFWRFYPQVAILGWGYPPRPPRPPQEKQFQSQVAILGWGYGIY